MCFPLGRWEWYRVIVVTELIAAIYVVASDNNSEAGCLERERKRKKERKSAQRHSLRASVFYSAEKLRLLPLVSEIGVDRHHRMHITRATIVEPALGMYW